MTLLTAPASPLSSPLRRWTSAEFDRLLALGLLREGGRTFLWDGKIYEPMAANPPHRHTVLDLADCLKDRLDRAAWAVDQDSPLALREGFKPQPDVAVYRGARATYRGRHPSPRDAALVIEVSDTTYPEDLGEMLGEYARAGIPQYWIANLVAGRVEVRRHPRVEGGVGVYNRPHVYGPGDSVPLRLTAAPDGPERDFGAIPVADFLHPAGA